MMKERVLVLEVHGSLGFTIDTGMDLPTSGSLLPIIQLSITPVILISGLGGLMIALTNRMARIVDRSRNLCAQIRTANAEEKAQLTEQLEVMWRRSNLMRWAVTCAAASMFVACLLICGIFLNALLGKELSVLLLCLFMGSLGFLIASLILFLRDLFISLVALGFEIKRTIGHD